MNTSPQFIRFAAVCCFLTVLTTLGIHVDFSTAPVAFEERIFLFRDTAYLFKCWWIIVHCLLVIVAMWGVALLQFRKSQGLIGLGLLFFVVFGITEITRQMFVLFYVNGLREQYATAASPMVKDSLRMSIQTFNFAGNALFGVFVLTFGLGNLCYGLCLWHERGLGKILSWMLLLWAVENFLALSNEFWRFASLETGIHYFSLTYQPLIRGVAGLWLWQKATLLSKEYEAERI